jgi:hypothetical protein
MCIYCGTSKYRKIYEHHHGPIPKDDQGRSFDIHHVDGNKANNDPSNLKAVSIQDHFDIHYSQGDWGACFWMSVQRMQTTPEQISTLASKAAQKRIENGTWHFNSENAKKWAKERTEKGTSYWRSKKHSQHLSNRNLRLVQQGTHPLLGSNNPVHKRVADGTHHFLGPDHNKKMIESGKHASQSDKTCPHCGTIMDSINYAKHHGDNCIVVKEKVPLSSNPNYVNSQSKCWMIIDTITGESYEIMGLKTWAKKNSFNPSTVTWSVNKYSRYQHYIIKKIL